MDLGGESSALESVENDELLSNSDFVPNPDGVANVVKSNGSCLNEIQESGSSEHVNTDEVSHDRQVGEGVNIEHGRNLVPNYPPFIAKSPPEGSPPPTSKGKGLKKWKRIKRDVVKDGDAHSDNTKGLKRGLLTSGNVNKPMDPKAADTRHHGEDSVGSVDATTNTAVIADGVAMPGRSGVESRILVWSASAAGVDSENSDDRSSKSSTAASAPRMRNDLAAGLGFVREKNRIKITSATSVSAQRVPQGKGRVESSKKARGERTKIEKENSHSSMESDSRSSNFVFSHGAYSVTSNGKHSQISINYGGENADEAYADNEQFFEEEQANCGQEDAIEPEDCLRDDLAADASWECKEENGEDRQYTTDLDPLAKSICTLQSVQEALEAEVQKLGELGKHSNAADTDIPEPSSSDQFDSEFNRPPSSLEFQVSALMENVKDLEIRLDEANSMLKVKESRITALEVTLNSDKSSKKESLNTIDLKQDGSREVEHKIEDLYQQKIEREVEYVVLTNTLQMQRVAAGDPVTLLDEQARVLSKLGEAENKAALLEKQAEEWQKYSIEILATEEALKMEKKLCKSTTCFCIELILLVLVFWLLFMQLSPQIAVIVPT